MPLPPIIIEGLLRMQIINDFIKAIRRKTRIGDAGDSLVFEEFLLNFVQPLGPTKKQWFISDSSW